MHGTRLLAWRLILAGLMLAAAMPAQAADEAAFYRACYLQTEERNFAAAAELFEQAVADGQIPQEIRTNAQRRLAECREEIAAADLAALMPAETIAYVQFSHLGAQARQVLETLGLTGQPADAASTQRIPIEDGLSFPIDFAISPALVREISKLDGLAAAFTGVDGRGAPQGVAVIHVGDSDLVRGLVETGLQVVTPNQSIEGYATYRIPADHGVELWLAQTERLLVLSPSRELIAGVVARLKGSPPADSLKDAPSFAAAAEARGQSLLFAWADSQRAAPLVYAAMAKGMRPREMMAASAVINLQQLECATFALGATDGGVRAAATVRFVPGHQHLIYSLFRTAPIGVDALAHVPASAAAVAAIGLNPPAEVGSAAGSAPPQVALMDVGREIFANVRSASFFIAPGAGPLPDVGVVVFAQDAAKSRELWTQLIGLPARLGVAPPEAAGEAEIAGRQATRYAYPGAPPILVSQPSDDALLVGTQGAVESALLAADGATAAEHLWDRAGAATSKAIFLQFGPLTRFAAAHARGRERQHMEAIAPLLDDATASLTVDEDPNELRIRLEVAGVPRVAEVLRTVSRITTGPQLQAAGGR